MLDALYTCFWSSEPEVLKTGGVSLELAHTRVNVRVNYSLHLQKDILHNVCACVCMYCVCKCVVVCVSLCVKEHKPLEELVYEVMSVQIRFS